MSGRTLAWISVLALLQGCVTVPEFRSLEREVSEMKSGGAGPGGLPDSRLADLGSEVADLREEVGQLRGALEAVRHTADQAAADAKAALDAQASGERGPVAATPGAPELGAEAGSLSEEVRSYEEAFRLYRGNEYQAAIDRFKGFLQTYPSSDYADNALFWLGECHFKLGDHEGAVVFFDDVVKRYPDGNKVADALYRQGLALLEIGRSKGQEQTYRPAARQIFERLLKDYPDSDRVPEARRQLEKLGT